MKKTNMQTVSSPARRVARASFVFILIGALAVGGVNAQTNTNNVDTRQGGGRRGAGGRGGRGGRGAAPRGVYKSTVTAHWFNENSMFWYCNELKGDTREFILVDPEKGTKQPAFDHKKLAAALSKAADKSCSGDKLPFKEIEFVDGLAAVQFTVGTNRAKTRRGNAI